MNNFFPRFIPACFAALALIGCFLPLIGMGKDAPNLVSIPGMFDQAITLIKGFGMGRNEDAVIGLEIAAFISRIFYIVPVMAILVILSNLRGLPFP